jgi:hypothetical protein
MFMRLTTGFKIINIMFWLASVANRLVHLKTLHWSIHAMEGTDYFVRAVSYVRKMFMKLPTDHRSGVQVIKLLIP